MISLQFDGPSGLYSAVVSSPSPIRYRRAGSETGSGRNMTASMSVKIAVVPPIPNAIVRTAAAVNTRDAQNCLPALRIEAIRRFIVAPYSAARILLLYLARIV